MKPFFFGRSCRVRGLFSSRSAVVGAVIVGALTFSGCGGGGGGNGIKINPGDPDISANTIVFVSSQGSSQDIYRISSDGTKLTQLTNSPAADIDPAIARNLQYMVFSSDRDGNSEIYRFNFADSSLQRFTTDVTNVADTSPAISADSSHIAWASERGGPKNIWIMDSTGANQTQVTTAGGIHPTFSPDGTQIAYVNPANNIVVHTLAGGAERTITTNIGTVTPIYFVKWSPNGTSLAFANTALNEIQIIPASATNLANAVNFGPSNSLTTGFAWGPDSKKSAYTGSVDKSAAIFVADSVTASTSTRITTSGPSFEPGWTN